MESIVSALNWLESREELLSAIAAIFAIIGIGYGVLAFIFPGINQWARRNSRHDSPTAETPAAVPAEVNSAQPPGKSTSRSGIAVLPLRTLSSNEEDQNIAAGISSEISADLAQLAELRVASRLATMQFQDDNISLKEVSEALSIRFVLTGSFLRQGDRMRLMAELTDALDGEQLWASTYDRDLSDLFEVQGEVSKAIVAAIGGEIKLADSQIAYDAPTDNLDAWGLVQKAFNFWLTHFTPDDYDHSLSLLRKAVKLDPEYAAARASLAMILSQRVINAVSVNPIADAMEALEMIEEAIKLGPRDLNVLENAGLVWTHHGQAPRAIEALRKVVERAPLNFMAWGYLSFPLGWAGNHAETEEAVAILDRLLTTAPKHPSQPYWLYFRSSALTRLGRLEEAERDAYKTLELQPAWFAAWVSLANIHGRQGLADQAKEDFQNCLKIHPLVTIETTIQLFRLMCITEEAAEPLIEGFYKAGLVPNNRATSEEPVTAS